MTTHPDPRRWQSRGLYDTASLDTLFEANFSWLDTLLRLHACRPISGWPSPVPGAVAAGLAVLNGEQRAALARTPYSLFDMRFTDSAFWEGVGAVRFIGADGGEPMYTRQMRDILTVFAQEALLCAWHLVQINPRAARGLLGMSIPVADVFARFSTRHLLQVATRHPEAVQLRAAGTPGFWRALLCAAGSKEKKDLAYVQTLGALIMAGTLPVPRSIPFGT